MKAIFIFILCLPIIMKGQLLNGSFDNWESNEMYGFFEDPVHWTTNNGVTSVLTPSTPVVKIEDEEGIHVSIASEAYGIDTRESGSIWQKIQLKDLKSISYNLKCDSLYGNGSCVFLIYKNDFSELLYSQNLFEINENFEFHQFDIPDEWTELSEDIIVMFRAYGWNSFVDPEVDDYARMFLDDVKTDYVLEVENKYEIDESGVEFFPNPVNNFLKIDEKFEYDRALIYNLSGKLIKLYGQESNLDLSNLKQGSYILNLRSNNGREISQKFQKN